MTVQLCISRSGEEWRAASAAHGSRLHICSNLSPLPTAFRRRVFIQYVHLLDDDTGGLLAEWVHPANVRPVQPAPEPPEPIDAYCFGDQVDVRVSDMWWEGVVVPGRCTSPSGARIHTVRSTRAQGVPSRPSWPP